MANRNLYCDKCGQKSQFDSDKVGYKCGRQESKFGGVECDGTLEERKVPWTHRGSR